MENDLKEYINNFILKIKSSDLELGTKLEESLRFNDNDTLVYFGSETILKKILHNSIIKD